MTLDEATQQSWKRRIVIDALERIGGIHGVEVGEVVTGPSLGYRNRVEFTLGVDSEGTPIVGLHSSRGDGLVDVDRCLLQHEDANAVLLALRRALRESCQPRLASAEPDRKPRVTIRRASASGEILVVLRDDAEIIEGKESLAHQLVSAHPRIAGVVLVRGAEKRRGGARVECLAGSSNLHERIGGFDLRVPATTFVQVHATLGDALHARAIESAGDVQGARVLDLYGGVGTTGLALAREAAEVTICDADASAIACGREVARGLAYGPQVRFVQDDVAAFVERLAGRGARADVVLANPPRTGMGRRATEGILALGPERVVITSCDPATLARDGKVLAEGGYELQSVTPFDVFPQTAHVEALASFRKRRRETINSLG